jgi:polysaccharide export outer membrane protein
LKVLARRRAQRYLPLCVVLVLFSYGASSVSAQDVSVVGTPQQANEKIRTLSAASKSAPHEYAIGNGDLLSISVFDVPELTREVRVSQSGTIGIPLVPTRLHISGLTEIQAEQMIADVLQANGLVSHPEVGVMVKEHRSKPITIVGAVQHPMVYEADRSVTLLEALAEAGGIAPDAGDTIIVTRAQSTNFVLVPNPDPVSPPAPGAAESETNLTQTSPASGEGEKDTASTSNPPAFPSSLELPKTPPTPANSNNSTGTVQPSGNIITVSLNELLETGDVQNNIPLQAGDVVTVPHAGIVYVLGAVNKPGGFVLSNDRTQMTSMKVLALAGGLTRIAKLDHAVIIRKDSQGKQTETEIDLKKILHQQAEDLQMRASDVLYIPESRTKEALIQAVQMTAAIAAGVALYRLAYK